MHLVSGSATQFATQYNRFRNRLLLNGVRRRYDAFFIDKRLVDVKWKHQGYLSTLEGEMQRSFSNVVQSASK